MRFFDCCGHCRHDINDPPHDRPCIVEGCEDAQECEAREFQRCMENAQDWQEVSEP